MGGGPPGGPPAFLANVFTPKLVMEHQQEIGLKPAQAAAIKQAMQDTQQRLVDLQWRLEAESEALGKMLSADRVDEAAVLAKLDQVTAIEQQVKKANFTLLVRIKNQLDPEQQAKLRALRPARPFGPPGEPPPP
jgi:Spy/CpxP family protein refolding chaperone